MEILLRSIAILIEIIVLAAVFYYILSGVRLILFDMGLKQKYSQIIWLALCAVGCLLIVFFISHLVTFYPTI